MSTRTLVPLPPGSPEYAEHFHSAGGVTIAYEDEPSKQHVIEGDGLCPLIYHHLFKTTKGREHTLSTVRLPDTVVFDHNFPRAWFAYDAENKAITKRSSKMLDAQTMYEHFSKRSPPGIVGAAARRQRPASARSVGNGNNSHRAGATTGGLSHECDVVAQFFYTTVAITDEWESILTRQEKAAGAYAGQQLVKVEFLTADTLHDFLFKQQRKPDGVLQKFVLPKGEGTSRRNAQLQVLWSPLITVVYKRTNRHRLDDHSVALTERVSTYDGPRWHSEETMVVDETKARLTALCEDIADHFHSTEGKRLTRLGLYFKTDDQHNIWLLWCSGVRVAADSLNPSFLRVPLAMDMRTEVVNDGCTTVARMEGRRQRQKQLLALDNELYSATKDVGFAQAVNTSHKRQAKALDMRGMASQANTAGREVAASTGSQHPQQAGSRSPAHNPRHALYPSFRRVWTAQDAANAALSRPDTHAGGGGDSSGRRNTAQSTTAAASDDCKRDSTEAAAAEEMRVREELVALAMDAWYAVYSTTLAEDPGVMPTRLVALAAPLLGCLSAEELGVLARDLLGLQQVRRGSREAAIAEAHGTQEEVITSLFTVAPYLVTSGRRLDRPSAQVEKEVRGFFTDLFAYRGQEVVRKCLAEYEVYFEDM